MIFHLLKIRKTQVEVIYKKISGPVNLISGLAHPQFSAVVGGQAEGFRIIRLGGFIVF